MADIILKTFKGGNVTPQDDAIIYQTVIPGAGVFKGCEVTVARSNVLHISQGFGIIKGRFYEMYENEKTVTLAETGETLVGRLYLHMDLSNADDPLQILTEIGTELSTLLTDSNVNYNNSTYDMELATFKVDSTGIIDLEQSFVTAQPGGGSGGGGGAGIGRETAYAVGDTGSTPSAPGWCSLVCTQAGTTGSSEPSGYGQISKVGDKVLDGTCIFTARNIIGEITDLEETVGGLDTTVQSLNDRLSSDTGAMVFKTMSLTDYRALANKDENTIYLCYDTDPTLVKYIYMGSHNMYSVGAVVTYQYDTGESISKTVPNKADAVAEAPAVTKKGYTLHGWRKDTSADNRVLADYVIESETPITLYAIFKKDITVSFDANGGDGEIADLKSQLYYNNGDVVSESIELPDGADFELEDYAFCGWTKEGVSTISGKPGNIVTVTDDTTFYAAWVRAVQHFVYTGNYTQYTIPQDGIYHFEMYGGSGGDVTVGSVKAYGGKGGYTSVYKKMTKGNIVYVYPGGAGGSNSGTTANGSAGANGGSYGQSYNATASNPSDIYAFNGGGGGASHVATRSSSLSSLSGYRDTIIAVAGGGGGASVTAATKTPHDGGEGGGFNGGNGSGGFLGGGQVSATSSIGDQFGAGQSQSGSSSNFPGSGGGYYGGRNGVNTGHSGAGGSGFIDNCPTFTLNGKRYKAETKGGQHTGHGEVTITYAGCA